MTAVRVVPALRGRAAMLIAAAVLMALDPHRLQSQEPQPASAGPPAFEVASVKPNRSSESGPVPIRVDWASGRFTATGVTLADLIRYAYRLERHQVIEGLPSWSTDRFDITAVAAEPPARPVDTRGLLDRFSSTAPGGAFHDMLQALLADRFQLTARWELRAQPVYALVLARADGQFGPNLQRSDIDCAAIEAEVRARAAALPPPPPPGTALTAGAPQDCVVSWMPLPDQGGRRVTGGARPLQDLIAALRTAVPDRPIVDRTGLSGSFTFDLQFAAEPAAAGAALREPSSTASTLPFVFAALDAQLGLRLEPQSAPVDTLVIEQVAPPSED